MTASLLFSSNPALIERRYSKLTRYQPVAKIPHHEEHYPQRG